jgi:hypothetical protein
MTADKILEKYEDDNEYHFHTVDRKWIIEAMEEYAALNKQNVIGSVCPNCNAKGYRTTVSSTSYACEKCLTWWTN